MSSIAALVELVFLLPSPALVSGRQEVRGPEHQCLTWGEDPQIHASHVLRTEMAWGLPEMGLLPGRVQRPEAGPCVSLLALPPHLLPPLAHSRPSPLGLTIPGLEPPKN